MSDHEMIRIYIRDPDGAEHWADLRFLLDVGTPVALTIAGVTYTLSDLGADRRTAFFAADDPLDIDGQEAPDA